MSKNLLDNLVKIVTDVPADVSTIGNRIISKLTIQNKPLTLHLFNPGGASIFPVSSTLIIGPTEVALVDAQFQKNDAQDLVKLIKACGKKLTLVYISHGDPDYYFGAEVIREAFPECHFYATQYTIDHIESTKAAKLAFWSPTLKENAPKNMVVPQLLKNSFFLVDGHLVEVKGSIAEKTFCWMPSIKAVVGGFSVFGNNTNLWIADDQTAKSRSDWNQSLTEIKNLNPDIVVPSHFFPGIEFNVKNVEFTAQYLAEVEKQLPLTKNSTEFIQAIEKKYPNLEAKSNLETSAKVLKGEMKWPQ